MGTFSVMIQVGDTAGRQFVEIEALVDTAGPRTPYRLEMSWAAWIDRRLRTTNAVESTVRFW